MAENKTIFYVLGAIILGLLVGCGTYLVLSMNQSVKKQEEQIAQLQEEKKEMEEQQKQEAAKAQQTVEKTHEVIIPVQPVQTNTATAQKAVDYEETVKQFSKWCDKTYYDYKAAGHDVHRLRLLDDGLNDSYTGMGCAARVLPVGSAERTYADRCYNALIKGSNMLKNGVDFNTAMADYHAIPEWE